MLALVLQAGRRVAAALAFRDFRLLWFGALVSSIGTWMQKVAQAWLIVTLTGAGSAFFLGLDSFLSEVPILLFTLIGGVVADRRDRRHLMLMSQCVQMIAAFTLALLVYTGTVRVWLILTLSFLTGIAQAFGGPAYQSLIPSLIPKEHLPNAIALNSIQFNLARVIGPLVAGAALTAFGMVACFGLNGVSFLFVMAAILALHVTHVQTATTERMRDQLKGGLRYVRDQPQLVTLTVLGFISAFLGLPLLTFLPIITKDVFQAGRRALHAVHDAGRRRRGRRRAHRRVGRQAPAHGLAAAHHAGAARPHRDRLLAVEDGLAQSGAALRSAGRCSSPASR